MRSATALATSSSPTGARCRSTRSPRRRGRSPDARRWCDEETHARRDQRRSKREHVVTDLQAPARRLRPRQRLASRRRRRPRVPRLHLRHRCHLARPCASGAGGGDRRTGADAAPHVEPLLPPAPGTGCGAADEAVRHGARVLRQQRHGSGGRLPEVRAALLVYAGRRTAPASSRSKTPSLAARWARSRSHGTTTTAHRSSR